MKNSIRLLFLALVSFSYSCAEKADNEVNTPTEITITPELIIDELPIPWGMAFLPDGSMLITEKSGELIHFKDGTKTVVNNSTRYLRNPDVIQRLEVRLGPDYKQARHPPAQSV